MRPAWMALGGVLMLAGCSGGSGQGALPPINLITTPGSASASASDSASASAGASDSACKNASVSPEVKSALLTAYGKPGATVKPGTTFFGICGDKQFGVATYDAAPAFFATTQGSWVKVGDSSGNDCSDFSAAPDALRALWGDCKVAAPATSSASPTASATATASVNASCAAYAAGTFAIVSAVTLSSDGTATLTATPATVHCGGPDDHQFVPGDGTESLVIGAGADLQVLNPHNFKQQKTDLRGLQRSVAANVDGNTFQVSGPSTGLTAVVQQYRP